MPQMSNNWRRTTWLIATGLLMGALFSFQSKSVTQANNNYNRESRSSIFKEIQIVKKSNQNLSEQISDLEKELVASTDKEKALENINNDIVRMEILTGQRDITGPGVKVEVNGEMEALWFVDMVNELYSAGAEAISVNGIRLVQGSLGFDTIPNGQILLTGEILQAPYTFEAIGDKNVLKNSLNQSGGIIERIIKTNPEYQIQVEDQDKLTIEAKKAD
ncbi:DUF881 domain-containing protein [Candidatus Peregrinibacteria bacterium]|nr:DUF881 domain-containing protein [Candidatus Peregrinibacteria bacterium]